MNGIEANVAGKQIGSIQANQKTSAKSEPKSGNKVVAFKTPQDQVSIRDPLDLRLGQDMLMSSIGRKIDAMFEEHGVDLDEYEGMDMSVDATAQRIFEFATGMLEVWKEQHPDDSSESQIDSFEKTIRGAVEDGYKEAMKILEGMEKVDEGILKTAKETIGRVSELFDEYFVKLREDQTSEPVEPANNEGDAQEVDAA